MYIHKVYTDGSMFIDKVYIESSVFTDKVYINVQCTFMKYTQKKKF